MNQKKAVIIGAGPAGLTAAYELVHRSDIKPIIYEKTSDIGGISKTVKYKGNRIDIGGHRFFSKSDRVMNWWLKIMQIQDTSLSKHPLIPCDHHNKHNITEEDDCDPNQNDRVMLVRNRLSRIFYLRKFFNYPISLNLETIKNLGLLRIARIGISYLKARAMPIKPETSLEDFLINRFGKELYSTFFKDYTEKVWGIACQEIEPEWGAQRIKGLSISKAILHALKQFVSKDNSISQKNTETSLIEKFLYPKFGPGQMWEEVAKIILSKGGEIILNHEVVEINTAEASVRQITVKNLEKNKTKTIETPYLFSTMPVKDFILGMNGAVPGKVKKIASGLQYRDFMTVGLLLSKLKVKNHLNETASSNLIPDNWIYIQERDVQLGRLQIFNNWSPYMVEDQNKVWIGLEYFCNEGDDLWSQSDEKFTRFAIGELAQIGIIDATDVLDSVVIRMPKTYPAYFGTYHRFEDIRTFTDGFINLFLIGRNGMHKYNNQDHSMLTAMQAVDNIINRNDCKDNIWAINTEEVYHEEKKH